MKHRIYFRQIFRTVSRSMGRLLAILGIVALGAGFLAGLTASSPTMKARGDQYYKDTSYMDVTLLCSLGITDEDVESLYAVSGVVSVWPTYRIDAMVGSPSYEGESAVRFSALPIEDANDPKSMNRLTLVSGRMPEKSDECVVVRGKLTDGSLSEGTVLTLSEEEAEGLSHREFTIVGQVESPEYISIVWGTTVKGSGSLGFVVFVPEEAFDVSVYTVAYVKAAMDPSISTYSEEYEKAMDALADRLETWANDRTAAREDAIRQEIQDEIDAGYEEFENQRQEAENQFDQAREELSEAEGQLNDADEQISAAEDELTEGRQQLDQAWGQLYGGNAELESAKNELEALTTTYQALAGNLQQLKEDTDAYLTQLQNQAASDEEALEALRLQWEADVAALAEEQADLDVLNEYLEAQRDNLSPEELAQLRLEYAARLAQFSVDYLEAQTLEERIAVSDAALTSLKEEIEAYQAEAEQKIAEAEEQLNVAYWTLLAKEEEYRAAVDALEEKKRELEEARQQVEEGWEELNQKEEEAQSQFDQALADLKEAENLLDEVPRSTWYVLPRSMNESYVSYESDSNRMKSIAAVFPWMFFVVAALVSLTTMTRMVEEERTQIGTYKALGFNKAEILNKYLLYAMAASLIGAIGGVILGFRVLPQVICDAYDTMYLLPKAKVYFYPKTAMVSIIASLVCTGGATIYACLNTLRSKPAVLMLPAAPKPGKKIFLEYIPFLWKPLSFTWKVTLRNLFRYQKRFWMTIIGIAGCTGLLLTGFGIKDSVMGIVDNQFHKVYQYDGSMGLSGEAEKSDVAEALSKVAGLQDFLFVRSKMIDVRSDDATVSCNLFVPETTAKSHEFIRFSVRTTGEAVAFEEGDVLLTEKGAQMLHVSVGDSIWVPCADGSSAALKITGICENYLRNYVYISPLVYQKTLGYETTEYTEVLFKAAEGVDREILRQDLLKTEGIATAAVMDDMIGPVKNMISSLDLVIIVLILSAAALAFIVLYNLTNINIIERKREIATIKVLGFHALETATYIFRETLLLTLIGCGLGIPAGIVMHRFVIATVEVDYVMFGREISNSHFLIAAGLTVLFSLLVDFVMYFHLKKIDMVESLKSVE